MITYVLLGRHDAHPAGVLHRIAHRVACEQVELLLQIARNVHRAGGTEDVGETGTAHVTRDDLGRETQVVQQVG